MTEQETKIFENILSFIKREWGADVEKFDEQKLKCLKMIARHSSFFYDNYRKIRNGEMQVGSLRTVGKWYIKLAIKLNKDDLEYKQLANRLTVQRIINYLDDEGEWDEGGWWNHWLMRVEDPELRMELGIAEEKIMAHQFRMEYMPHNRIPTDPEARALYQAQRIELDQEHKRIREAFNARKAAPNGNTKRRVG
jgi:hypothetical protein